VQITKRKTKMKKLIVALAAVGMAVAANAAAVTWQSGTILDPNGDVANKSVTAYLWVIDSATYDTLAANTTGKAMSDAVYAAYGTKTGDAYASKTTSKKGVADLTDDSKSYGESQSAYSVLLYTYGSGDDLQYMGNVGKVTFESPMDMDSEAMGSFLLGNTTAGATAWSTAAVPEPTSGLLLLLGMAGLALKRKRA
jgi:hypothetical protein